MSKKPFRLRYLVILFWVSPLMLAPFVFAGWIDGALVFSVWFTGNIFLGAFLARLYRRSAAQLLRADPRPPVVYLRNFNQEDLLSPANINFRRLEKRTVLFMLTLLLVALLHGVVLAAAWSRVGIDSMEMWPLLLSILTVLSATVFTLTVCFRTLYGQLTLTLEAELAKVFRCVGPMIAIGRPGDWFSPRGAARMYLTDETWQTEVLRLIKDASVVVMQPALTDGTWWELRNVVRLREPRTVLFCLAQNFRLNDPSVSAPLSSDVLFHELAGEFNIRVGDCKDAHFVCFDDGWQPMTLPPVFRHWLLSPFVSWRLSRRTFALLIEFAQRPSNHPMHVRTGKV